MTSLRLARWAQPSASCEWLGNALRASHGWPSALGFLLARSGPMAVEPPFEAPSVGRHGEAADEEEHCGEDVALLGQAQPRGILERLIDGPEKVDETDDGDQRGILEEIDDVVDDPRHDDAQGLRQGDEHLH